MKWYGSIENRMEEGYTPESIAVGMGVTEYGWSDRHAYEITAVKDQKHITIREYDHKAKGEPMSNDWELVSNPNNAEIDLVRRGNYWYTVHTCTKEELLPMLGEDGKIHLNNNNFDYGVYLASTFDFDKVLANGKQTKYHKMNISIGKASYYYDYEF